MRPLDQQTNQKQEQRYRLDRSATVKVLGIASEMLHGEIRSIGKKGGTQVLLDQPLRCASLVAIDYDDNRLLGEVVYSVEKGAGWLVGIRVEHALFGLATLASLGKLN
jgi:hypothetical protein